MTGLVSHARNMTDQNTHTTTIPEMLTADDPRAHVASAVTTARAAVEALTPDQYDLPTTCGPMTVGDLAEHLVMALRNLALAGRGEPPSNWPHDASDVPAGEWAPALASAAGEVHAAWGEETLDRPTIVPWGEFPGREVLGTYVNELLVHTWEIARATGQDPDWDEAAVGFADWAIHEQLPMADRTEMWNAFREQLPPGVPWTDPFGPAVEVPDDAEAIERLVAWNGRTP